MNFKSSIVLSVIMSAALVSARPLNRRALNATTMMPTANAQAESFSAGAAYFMTNEPSGNFVIAADISSSGKLTLDRAVYTEGLGAHGITSPNGPDGLFAQGSVKASATGNVLATVNPGSNTISLFSIDPNYPANINMIGAPVSSEGEFPMSLAFNSAGNMVCVLNGGTVNGVNCYSVNQTSGLTAIPNTLRSLGLNQTTPATGPAGTTSHIIFSEDNKQLMASVKGTPPTPGFIAVWDVNDDGTLSPDFTSVAPQAGGLLPFSMTIIPGANAILATDAGVGFDIFDFAGNANAGNASGSSVVPIEGQMATCWSSFSSETGNFYLTDIGTAIVTEVNVDSNLKGTIVKQYPQGNGSGTIDNDVATVGGKDFLYVLAANASKIDVLSLNGPGQAQAFQTVDIAGPAKAVGLSVDPFNLQGMTTYIKST